ncbi:hypothetical protein ACU61A_15720 [Pseudonocardia sichuanensis]
MFTFTVDPDEGERFQVTAKARDVLVWERQKPGRSITKLLAETHLTDAYALAHIALKREERIEIPLREFETTHDLALGVDPEPDPTRRGR